MEPQITNGNRHDGFLRKLYPIFELSALVRPRTLWVAPVMHGTPILLGMLYHTEKQAFQYRLRFQAPGRPDLFRRTRWLRLTEPRALHRSEEKIQRGFQDMAKQIGSTEAFTVQFAREASDQEILDILVSSRLPGLFSRP